MPELSHLAVPGAVIAVRVLPRSRRPGVTVVDAAIRIGVGAPPEGGRATAEAQQRLAEALGVAPSRLTLVAGATARAKRFRLD